MIYAIEIHLGQASPLRTPPEVYTSSASSIYRIRDRSYRVPFSIHRYRSTFCMIRVTSQSWAIDLAKTSSSWKDGYSLEMYFLMGLSERSRRRAHNEAHGHPLDIWESSSHSYNAYASYNVWFPFPPSHQVCLITLHSQKPTFSLLNFHLVFTGAQKRGEDVAS